jgi:amidase
MHAAEHKFAGAPPHELSLCEAAAAIARGDLTSEALVADCLNRVETRDSAVGAWAFLDREAALANARSADREQSRGPLHGVPIAVKDVIDTAAMPTGFGSPIYADHQPGSDAHCIRLLREAGAVIVGKTVTAEFATYQPGPTANPLNLAHTPGGSSSGSAAAVADFQVPAALGTQTAGSVVRPASYCGILGFKPTLGRYSTEGVLDTAPNLDTLGMFVRSPTDALLLDSVLADGPGGRGAETATLRVGLYKSPQWSAAEPEMQQCLEHASRLLKADGMKVERVELPPAYDALADAQTLIHAREVADCLGEMLDLNSDKVSAALIEFLSAGRGVTQTQYEDALATMFLCRERFADDIDGFDVLLTPGATGVAPRGLEATGNPVFSRMWTALGAPCIGFPVAAGANGLPLGLQLIGRPDDDSRLLRVVADIQNRISNWSISPPGKAAPTQLSKES